MTSVGSPKADIGTHCPTSSFMELVEDLAGAGVTEVGTASTKQAAVNLAERVLPPDAEYIITTLFRTVHHGRTSPTDGRRGRAR